MSDKERKKQESARASAMRVMDASRPVLNTPSQVGHAALLGVSLLFLATILTVPRSDWMLTYAVIAFAAAIPLLVWGYILASFEFDPVPGVLVVRCLVAAAQLVAAFGWLGVGVGVVLVIWHIDENAAKALGISLGVGILLTLLLALVLALAEALRALRKEQADASDPGSGI